MKIALFGATGMIGQRVLHEALQRGHVVTAIVRDPGKLPATNPNLKTTSGDILDPQSVAAAVTGSDAVISAFGPGPDSPEVLLPATRALIAGLKEAGVKRLVVVGGAGSLEVAPGVELVDAPTFPAAWKGIAIAHRDAYHLYKTEAEDLDWSYASPAALIEPGERTGVFRWGTDQLLTDAEGQSRISAEDFAIALLDEAEQHRHIKARFTVAY